MNTKVLNIDALIQDAESSYKIIVDGKEHGSVAPDVEGFLANLKDMEELSKSPSIASEIQVVLRLILRAFPTVPKESIQKWPIDAIYKLFTIVQGLDADETPPPPDKGESVPDEGNAPAAS